ncbi:hypothetical protein HHA33_05825 [Phytobacter diazotrophicus]|uniref:hypothetical protein n=1 Tax=Phytobacter diazotrophicus TaxID=395631 RepID=UPI0014521A18|nr:hypothetical protein [Phytobacter diazotrophicus]QJF16089.1 hypothetical protein HHA33_05825 [Phytobacter diazotrophicus]
MAGQLDEAAKQILGTLLVDFNDRGLTAKDLQEGYEGPRIETLATAVCNSDDINTVDFELAFGDLENKEMISTGPLKAFDNDPYSGVIVIGMFSERIYAHLTEKGYKAARDKPNRPQHQVQRIVNNLNITGGSFSNLQLAQGESVKQEFNVAESSDSEIVNKLIEILEAQGVEATAENRAFVTSAVAEANNGNAGNAQGLLSKAFGVTWDTARKVAVPVIAEVVKKSLGM